MDKKIVYDFDAAVSREGTHAEKYESLKTYFGTEEAEPFWVADMDLESPAFLVEALQERIAHPMFGYTEHYGEIFDAVAWWMKHEHDVALERDWIKVSPSVVTSIVVGLQSMCEEGDGVVILSPVYGPFFLATKANNRRVVDFHLDVTDGQFAIDFDALEATFKNESPRLLLMCNPQNPGGRVWSREELTRLVQLCTTYNVRIFGDEIHSDIVYPPLRHVPLLSIEGAAPITVVAHSTGKTFNASGLKTSFVMIPDDDLRRVFDKIAHQFHVENINLLGKVALTACLSPQGAEYKRQLVAYLHENTRLVSEKLRAIPHLPVMEPQATFLVWADFRHFGKWPTVMRKLLDEANVALSGGDFFGPAGKGWFRINCAHPRHKLLPAMDRIVRTFQ